MARLPHSRRVAATLVAVLVCAVLAAPSAFARVPTDGAPPAVLAAAGPQQQPVTRTVIERVRDNQFHLGDAAIGAGAAAALILLVLGGLAARSHPRLRLTH